MTTSVHNEYGMLVSVLLKRTKEAFQSEENIEKQWKQLNYTDKPDFNKSIEEYQKFEQLISSTGTEVVFMQTDSGTGLDSIYVRDAAIATNRGMIICNMGKEPRSHEPRAQRDAYENRGIEVLGEIIPPGTVEGGDVVWIDENTLLIGRGYRTNENGIRQVKELVSDFADVIEVHLPYYKGPADVFHLMSIFSPIDKDLAVVFSPLMTVPFREFLEARSFRFVEVPEMEFDTMGCNVLAVGPSDSIMVEGNPVTRSRLIDAGVRVQVYAGKEISEKGCGGPTCLTRPLSRQI